MKVNIVKSGQLHIRVDSDSKEYSKLLKDNFTFYVENYFFMKAFQDGRWDGTICLVKAYNTLPFGLLLDLMNFHIRNNIEQNISPEVKELFTNGNKEYKQSLTLSPYPYQNEAITKCLERKKGIIRSCTASGKSLMIAYVINHLRELGLNQQIIVVPTKSLVQQFYTDLIDYGFEKNNIGRIFQDVKEYDKPFTISTWQSLKERLRMLPKFGSFIIDECVTGDTYIKTPNGNVKIKNLKKGDCVFSYNIKTQSIEKDKIIKVFNNLSNEKLYELEFTNGVKLKVTGNHKIFTNNRGYVRADCLNEQDDVVEFI